MKRPVLSCLKGPKGFSDSKTYKEENPFSVQSVRKLLRHYKRLRHLSFSRKTYYIAQTLFGEVLRKRTLSSFGPRLIEITLTHRCQCRCVHCYDERAPTSVADELSTSEVRSLLDQAYALGCCEVCFTGGEPLLRQDLLELIEHARKKQLVPKINTNGILLDLGMIRNLKQAGLIWCSVSIDSHQPERHDELRRYKGCFKKAVEGIKELVRQNVAASITTYARKDGVYTDSLQKIINLGHELNVETVRILFPVPMGGFKHSLHEILTFEERERVRRYLKDPIVTMESPHERIRCTAAVTKMNIQPNGTVTPCVFIPLSYGNIREERLTSIWKRMVEFDRSCKPDGKCPFCDPVVRDRMVALSGEQSCTPKRPAAG